MSLINRTEARKAMKQALGPRKNLQVTRDAWDLIEDSMRRQLSRIAMAANGHRVDCEIVSLICDQ